MRVCQPSPVALQASTISASSRLVVPNRSDATPRPSTAAAIAVAVRSNASAMRTASAGLIAATGHAFMETGNSDAIIAYKLRK